jgi:uncharacterized protein YeaO (DUF488 family)
VPLKTKRWNDPAEPDDGYRLLITRYRPRGVAKEAETWHEWQPKLGPSTKLHAAVYAESHSPVPWPVYRKSYLAEQRSNAELIDALAKRIASGETITLLCSSACTRESRCHRSLLRELIEARVAPQTGTPAVE